MFYELENFKKRMDNAEFSFNLTSNLNKCERNFLNFLLGKFLKTDNLKVEINNKEIISLFKFDIGEITEFLDRLSKKSISYYFNDVDDNLSGSFNLINAFLIKNNTLFIQLPKEVKYSKYIKVLYSFSNKASFKFYSYFIKNFVFKKNFTVKIEDFKDILNTDNKYERFFDFEKFVLKSLLKDLENSYKIGYNKIKSGSNLNNKVIEVNFFFHDEISEADEELKLKSILFMIKTDISDVGEVYSILKNGIQNHGYEVAYKTCFKIKHLYKKSYLSFNEVLKASFKKLDLKDTEPTLYIKKIFSSPKEFKKCFLNELDKIRPGVILDTSFFSEKFLQELFLLNNDKAINFKNTEFQIFINWKNNDESIIKIYLV
ncbi:MAG: hypothetical protein ACRC0S_06755 [Fusobacteriaceae bacterium]